MALSRRRFAVGGGAAVGLALGCQSRSLRRSVHTREVEQVIAVQRSRDGAGVALRRALGNQALPMLDPFLLLDEIHSDRREDYIRGFPSHPHRGFETVSYLIKGAFEHADSVGNAGIIGPGDTQWMTAGRGIIHSEMPVPKEGDELWGLQLWVNLPGAVKMTQPRYQEISRSAIPELDAADARVRLVAGALGGTRGPIDGIHIDPTFLDVTIPAGGEFRHTLTGSHAAFAFLLSGRATFGTRGREVKDGHTAIFGTGTELRAASQTGARFLCIAGAPIGEPVARRGPFVMNTEEELRRAFEDYRTGRLVGG